MLPPSKQPQIGHRLVTFYRRITTEHQPQQKISQSLKAYVIVYIHFHSLDARLNDLFLPPLATAFHHIPCIPDKHIVNISIARLFASGKKLLFS